MVTPLSTHASLLARLSVDGDALAWSEFSDRYRELIRGFALRRGLQAVDADDLLQDVFVALTTAMRSFEYDPQRGRFRGFLKTIAVRTLGHRLRRKEPRLGQSAAEIALETHADGDPYETDWESEWRQYHLRTAMQRVRAEFRATDLRAFELLTNGALDAKAVAEQLGISVDSAYQAKSRILKRLRALVLEQVAEEG